MSEQDLNAPVQLPQNIDGVNIHLSYIRRDLESINKKIDSLGSAFVTHEQHSVVEKDIKDHEDRIRILQEFQDTLSGKMWGIGIMAGVLSTALGIIISHFWK